MSDLTLSVLDQSPIAHDSDAGRAFDESLKLAQRCEALGYHRYWLAEHHGSNTFAGASPEVLIAHIAAGTSRIRIGSGGVMLMHYSPLKVAENFRVLETLHPGRIDLGIGRAPGSDGLTASALAYGRNLGIEYFPARLADLVAFLSGDAPHSEVFKRVRVSPTTDGVPECWVLGSSFESAVLAAELGLPYSFAHFINAPAAEKSVDIYRQRFKPSSLYSAPLVNLGVFVICAESDEEVAALSRCRDLWRLRFESGVFLPMPSIQEAAAYKFSDAELSQVKARSSQALQGTSGEVKAQLTDLAGRYQVEELVLLSVTPSYHQRMRCYELLADVFGLQSRRQST